MDYTAEDFKFVKREPEGVPEDSRERDSRESFSREKISRKKAFPWCSLILLLLILFCCLFAELVMNHSPLKLNLESRALPPGREFYFGTDPMGRDVFSMIWYGGRISLFIGLGSTLISSFLGILYGSISGFLSDRTDSLLMRFLELLMSVPSILLVVFIQAVLGSSEPAAIALSIGVTAWMNLAKIVRSEVRNLRNSGYIQAARTMHAGFFHILRVHILPNLIPAVMFMVVTNIGTAIASEATLSFLGIGLPVEEVSWGTILAQADQALLTGDWWLIVIPGIFLVVTLVAITNLGNYIRKEGNKKCGNL